MSKYIDLAGKITDDVGGHRSEHAFTLRWLDDHPDQVPGRTITESEARSLFEATAACNITLGEFKTELLHQAGITVAPDPEPANLDRLRRLRDEWIKLPANKATPFPKWLDERGVKAPEADDD